MDLQAILKKLISFPTISATPIEGKRALDWIVEKLEDLPVHINRFESNGFHSLLLTTRKSKRPKTILAAHLDVVPAPKASFSARQAGDRIYGRGACDMKFAIACYMRLLRELTDLGSYDIGVMITTDEEVGGRNGTEFILKQGYSADIAILPDSGSDWSIDAGAKGGIVLEAVSKGVAVHAARPWDGEDAISNLVEFLAEVKTLFPNEPRASGPEHRHDTMIISKIEGGRAINQLADHAMAYLSIRYMPQRNKDALKKKILGIKKRYPKVILKEVLSVNPCRPLAGIREIDSFKDIAQERYGIKVLSRLAHGSSDARFFDKKGIPTLVVRPKGGGSHTDREWISKKDMERFYSVLKEWVEVLR